VVKSYRSPTCLLCKTGKFIGTSEKEQCLHTFLDSFPPSASRPGRVRQGKAKDRDKMVSDVAMALPEIDFPRLI
jgi:hypothetical protein